MNTIILMLLLLLPQQENPELITDNPEMGFIFPGLGVELKKDIKDLEEQTGLINSKMTGIEARISRIETIQIGLKNTTVGSQILSGDVGMLTVIIFGGLGFVWLAYYQRRQIQQLKAEITDGK